MDESVDWLGALFRHLDALSAIQERIAAAEELRNELLVTDTAERRATWLEDKAQRDRVADALTVSFRRGEDDQVIEWLRAALDMSEQWAGIARGLVINERRLAQMKENPSATTDD